MAAQGANNGNGASRIGDMSELLGLSKLQEVLQSLAEEQAKVDATQEKQDEKISAASTRLDTLEQGLQEVTLTLVPELQRQLENIQEQCKAVEEATRKLRDQEAQLSSQSARVALLEKQVNERLASLEGKVSGIELKEEERYTEVKLAIASVQEGQTLQAEEIKAAEAARHEALQEERRRQQEAEALRESERAQLEAQLAQQVSLAWPLSDALAVDQALTEPELRGAALFSYEERGRQSTFESLYPPVKRSDWEADYVRDDMADHGQWEAQMDYDVARKQRRDMQKQAKNSMKAAVIAEEEFEDMQKKELALRDKMLQARSLAKKQEDVITALKAKQNWQEESLKWVEEDIKYGKGEIKKFEKAIKTVGQKIKEKEKRIEAVKHNHSPQKKAAFSAQEVQEMASRLQRLKKILQNKKAALKATRKKFQNLRKQELKAEKKLQQEETKQDQTGAQSDVLSSIWNRFGWS
ncbi:Tmem131 [Symbiodinium sp. CCMP2592]|nr:Tmem131 [Symbiodinium sp. CCMP2592]